MENKVLTKAMKRNIYRFVNGEDNKKMVLVVSDDFRCMDRMVNILMLGDAPVGRDVVQIEGKNWTKYVHCEMVTYCKREQLGELIGEISEEQMEEIEEKIAVGLGIHKTLKAERDFYQDAYNNLLNKVVVNN